MPIVNLTGQRFGRLVALRYCGDDGRKAWLCQCDCGAEKAVPGANLRSGKARSCGCAIAEKMAQGLGLRHGRTGSPEHKAWTSMNERCSNPKQRHWERYGGRGIRVCDRWASFELFFADMGERPSSAHSLDRIDNDGDYEPGNCRWATPEQQQNNRSISRRCVYQGVEYTARDLAALTGVPYHTLRKRIFLEGMPVDQAVVVHQHYTLTDQDFREITAGLAAGLSRAAIAARIGCSKSLVGHIATGRRGRPQLSPTPSPASAAAVELNF